MEYGDLPNWLNFVSTFIAAIAAIFALKFTKKLLEGDDWRNRQFHLLEKSKQASQVSAWASPASPLGEDEDIRSFAFAVVEGVIQNASNLPIYEVKVRWWVDGVLEQESSCDLVPPNESRIFTLDSSVTEKMSGIQDAGKIPQNYFEAKTITEQISEVTRLELYFSDAANVKWMRSKNGVLSEL